MFPKWVAARLDEIKAALLDDGVRLVVITGRPRKGKSTLGLRICRYLDHLFLVQRVVFKATNFKYACLDAPAAGAVMLDEAIRGGNARRAMSTENVGLMDWLTIWGHRNLVGVICYPKWARLDPAIKEFVDVRIHIPRRGVAHWHDVYHPDHVDKPVVVSRKRFRFEAIPDGPFRQAYLKKKSDFLGTETTMTDTTKKDLRRKLTDKDRAAIIQAVREGRDSHRVVAARFKVSRPYVTQLVKGAPAGQEKVGNDVA